MTFKDLHNLHNTIFCDLSIKKKYNISQYFQEESMN